MVVSHQGHTKINFHFRIIDQINVDLKNIFVKTTRALSVQRLVENSPWKLMAYLCWGIKIELYLNVAIAQIL